MSEVCDFSDQSIDLNAVAQHFGGFLSYASDYIPKNLTKSNFDDGLALHLEIGMVCEQGNQPALRGAPGGTHDAQISNAQADALGYTGSIYFVGEDPSQLPSSDWPIVESYFQAAKAASRREVCGYGGWATLNNLHGLGLISKGWMVETWNQGAPDPLPDWIVLLQLVGADTFGLPVDADSVLQPNWGQHGFAPTPSPVVGDDEMPFTDVVQFKGGQWDIWQVSPGGFLYHKWSFDEGKTWPGNEVLPSYVLFRVAKPVVTVSPDGVRVRVEDNGPGHIFQAFQSVSGTSWSWTMLQ